MTSFDYVVLGVVGLSVLLSVMRGFIREVLALAGWIAAFFVAKIYMLELLPLLPQAIPTESLRLLVAFLILFLATLLVCTLLAITLSQIFKKIGLGWLDRIFGGVFGLMRGIVIVGILVFLGGFTTAPKDMRWRNAMFSAPLEYVVISLLPWFPSDVAKHIKYD
jgi:membrane protein required for colicin V production